ncbi:MULTISPECIES: GNAT family N-acetyltransferase [unclassified Colwellia]|uniref:GNAT family N-acetyltransferase n=1 Tax=unclassified Colwellia TaxID=196834 RepID=UPI0015F6B48D|nr:GNAT family N-acetyltransferase [Colwellia sp. MB02u-7]MBA6235169.1 GNAT family N-acetyltransferase [Colwellia sp. MB02u-11]MBA6297953.1 GNAT family N-acetyltransferase [Colwellia sp. MB3u-22]MBA6309662.1 GNAT family N-acetyltransferase [Colwellia sp. MB3u-64]
MSIVETERLHICEVTDKDSVALRLVLSDPEIMKYSIVGVHSDEEITKYIANCKQQYDTKGYGQWAIFSKADNSFVGICGLNSHSVEGEELLHLSYRLSLSQQGKGFASEATSAVVNFCKEKLKRKNISALIDPNNVPSINVATRAGFSFFKSSSIQGFNVDIYQVNF